MTYEQMMADFIKGITPELREKIVDFRPCECPYTDIEMKNAIVVYTNDGREIVYKAQNEPVSNFRDITDRIAQLAQEELMRANTVNSAFHSKHEGVGVLLEEKQEANREYTEVVERFVELVEAVFDDRDYKPTLEIVRNHAVLCASELIQVIAMCDKLKAVE